MGPPGPVDSRAGGARVIDYWRRRVQHCVNRAGRCLMCGAREPAAACWWGFWTSRRSSTASSIGLDGLAHVLDLSIQDNGGGDAAVARMELTQNACRTVPTGFVRTGSIATDANEAPGSPLLPGHYEDRLLHRRQCRHNLALRNMCSWCFVSGSLHRPMDRLLIMRQSLPNAAEHVAANVAPPHM